MSMITAAQWVPRGFAAPVPTKYELDESEFERIAALAKLQLENANEDLEDTKAEASPNGSHKEQSISSQSKPESHMHIDDDDDDDDLKEYDLEHYDDDDDDDDDDDNGIETADASQTMGMFGHVKALTYHDSNQDDPYITLKGDAEEDDDRDDLQILATDNLILAAKVEDDLAQLEVYVYEDDAENLYVHHDIMLPAIPLCVEWIDFPVKKDGAERDTAANFVAVGTMDPEIEIWDLDIIDSMYPNAILGQSNSAEDKHARTKKKTKKKKKSLMSNDAYHVDAVLSLAANRKHRNLLASASADKTIKLWDLNTTQCAKSYSYHTDKVCSLAWHAVESTVLLSGSYDRTVVAADMRAPEATARPRWGVESDVETVRWDPHDANFFFVSTESGMVHYHDVRAAPSTLGSTKAVWTLQAHDESVTSFDVNPTIQGFIATGSTDRTVKLWNFQPGGGPTMVVSRNLEVGKIFSAAFAPDAEVAFRLAIAGSKGTIHVWDTSTNAGVRKAFAHRVPERGGGEEVEERLVGVMDDEEEEAGSSDGEDGGVAVGDGSDMDEDQDQA